MTTNNPDQGENFILPDLFIYLFILEGREGGGIRDMAVKSKGGFI